ncbi:UNVERIFIED_CONTAM: hypothetical protein Slati_1380400 [Sesamum latifolium]|uniref:Integrase zinc-binding domain-containing protein n=1 Tax=Sesamum latifolium TaxID=2727402 RepID=A0AAW2X2L6_9LAMI
MSATFYWPAMLGDIKIYIRECTGYQRAKYNPTPTVLASPLNSEPSLGGHINGIHHPSLGGHINGIHHLSLGGHINGLHHPPSQLRCSYHPFCGWANKSPEQKSFRHVEEPAERVGAIKELELNFEGLGRALVVRGEVGGDEEGLANWNWRAVAVVVFS